MLGYGGRCRFSDLVRGLEVLDDDGGIESLDWVFDELYDERAETDVAAVFTVELIAVTDALTASFFDELLKRKTDFHDESIVGGIVDHCEQGELSGCPDRTN